MRKTCSIRLLVVGIVLTAAISLCLGFLTGTRKNWDNYEQHIAMLKQQNETLLTQWETQEKENELEESLNVVEPYQYLLLAEDGYVAVYHADGKTFFSSTDILLIKLPEDLQAEIQEGKYITSEEQLYNFLESYSS